MLSEHFYFPILIFIHLFIQNYISLIIPYAFLFLLKDLIEQKRTYYNQTKKKRVWLTLEQKKNETHRNYIT